MDSQFDGDLLYQLLVHERSKRHKALMTENQDVFWNEKKPLVNVEIKIQLQVIFFSNSNPKFILIKFFNRLLREIWL